MKTQHTISISNILLLPLALALVCTSCSSKLDSLVPDSLDEKRETIITKKLTGKEALSIHQNQEGLKDLLSEFTPTEISSGVYNYKGIVIHFGIAKLYDHDDAYGLYSGLTARPRERWRYKQSEISYKSPFVAGITGIHTFFFYSPSNPTNYSHFYRKYGEKLIDELQDRNDCPDDCRSYHWKLLPRPNRYRDSAFYISKRHINEFIIENAYGATYQVGHNIAHIYIEKFDTDNESKEKYQLRLASLKRAMIKTKQFPYIAGGPVQAIYWEDTSGVQVLYQYRWLCFYLTGLPKVRYANGFVRDIYANMQKIAKVVTKKKAK